MPRPQKRNPRGAGRKPLPEGKARDARAVCWLRPAEKDIVAEYAKKEGLSESDLLRKSLETLGVLPKRDA